MSLTQQQCRWYNATIIKQLRHHSYSAGKKVYVKKILPSASLPEGGVVVFTGSHHQSSTFITVDEARECLKLGRVTTQAEGKDVQYQLAWSLES